MSQLQGTLLAEKGGEKKTDRAHPENEGGKKDKRVAENQKRRLMEQ